MLVKLKFLERSKKQVLNKLPFFIPCIFTFLNCIFGFCSILRSFDGDCKGAAFFIILAALADSLDGRLARALGSTSYLGTELDSLCDAISFCLAPSLLLYSWFRLEYVVSFLNLAFLAFYICAGIYRLAKFNIEGCLHEAYFSGLPTTISALFIASFCFYNSSGVSSLILYKYVNIGIFILGYLMLSSFKFYSFKKTKLLNQYFRNSWYMKGCLALSIGAVLGLYRYPLMLFFLLAYILSNLIYQISVIISVKCS